MMRAFAEAARVLGRAAYRAVAENNARFILGAVREGELFRTYKDGRARLNAYLEDYAFYAAALLELYATTFELRWYADARALVEIMLEDFADAEAAASTTPPTTASSWSGHEAGRPDDRQRHPGSGTSAAGRPRSPAYAALTGDERYRTAALDALKVLPPIAEKYPRAGGMVVEAWTCFARAVYGFVTRWLPGLSGGNIGPADQK